MKPFREADLVRQCLVLLALRGIFAWRNNTGAFVLGEGKARRYFRAGTVGAPDILGVLPCGRLFGVECKRPGRKPTPAQEAFLARLRQAGAVALVIESVTALDCALCKLLGPVDSPWR
jgi:hypothetical protein